MRLPASAPTGEHNDQARVGTWSFDFDRSTAHGAASVQPHSHSSAPTWWRALAGLVLRAPTRIGGPRPDASTTLMWRWPAWCSTACSHSTHGRSRAEVH
jgi:hypothetical protein